MKKQRSLALILLLAIVASFGAAKKQAKEDLPSEMNKPRADARSITFEAKEGTWMSIDVSSNGTTLLFDLLGDIYTIPISGGTATRLTNGPAYDYHPRYSPDGKLIAFTSDRTGMENLWLMDADGKNPRALTDQKDAFIRTASWTPDSKYLIARKEDAKRAGIPPVELWMFHIYGGSGIKLTSGDELNNASGPAPSPDGRYIFFSARPARFSYLADISRGLWQIARFDRQTGEVLPLTSGFGGAIRPAVSPDGKTLTFIRRLDNDTAIIERNLATGAERVLVRGVTRDEQEGFGTADLWPNYSFTPDGKSLVFSNHGKIQRLDLSTSQLSDIPFTAKVEQSVAPRVAWQDKVETGSIKARILRWPSQSPDGRWIAFDAFGRVWLQEISGSKPVGTPRRLTTDGSGLPAREYSPAFSPDGNWISYVSWSDQEGGHVWKIATAGGSQPQKLTRQAGHYANPQWSPKGDRLVVIQGTGLELRGRQPEEEEYFEIRWLPAGGGDAQFITTVELAETLKFHPQAFWSADGARIFYRSPIRRQKPSDDPKNDLVSVRLDGTDKKRHLRFPAVADVVPSPDEEWIVFTSRDNVYVTPFPKLQTKEPPEVGLKDGSVPVWRLSEDAGGYVGWADKGETITWGLGNTFYRLPVSAAVQFAQKQKQKSDAKAEDDNDASDKKLKLPKSESIPIHVSAPRPVPEGSIVLRNARVITMKGDEILEHADIVITKNRIAAIGATGKVSAPSGAKEIDAQGKTIVPGLIDTHAHLHYSGMEIFPENKWEYVANLAYGVTTVYDPSAPSLDVFAQAEMVEAGVMLGPRVYSSGDVLYGGQQEDFFAEVNDQDDALRQVRRMKAYGARMIKVYQQPRREQRRWFAEACRQQHMLLTAEGAGELFTDLTMVMDGYTAFEHSLPVELYQDVIQLIAKSDTYYTPTLLVSYGGPFGWFYYYQVRNPHDDPKLNRFVPHRALDELGRRHPWISPEEYQFPIVARGVAKVMRAGGKVSLGAHGQLQGLGVHWEIWAMAGDDQPAGQSALSPMEALKASTILAADKIGFAPDLGSVEIGKLADLIVLDANPLDDIHNTTRIKYVIKNGELYDAETMRQEWPAQRDLPKFFWKQ